MTAASVHAADLAAAVPIGGSTGLDHESTAAIDEAASWLVDNPRSTRTSATVPTLRERFGLTVGEACQAIREASARAST